MSSLSAFGFFNYDHDSARLFREMDQKPANTIYSPKKRKSRGNKKR